MALCAAQVWYVTEVLSKFTKHTYVSLHDVHNPTFWGDDRDDPKFREVSHPAAWHLIGSAQPGAGCPSM